MATYEDEDGQPRYGQRLSPEELAAYLQEQGIEPPAAPPAPDADDVPELDSARYPASWRARSSRPGEQRQPDMPGPASWGQRPPRRRWRTFAVGLVLMILIPALMAGSAVLLVLDGAAGGGAPLGDNGTVYLEEGADSALYSSALGGSVEQCTVTDPAGSQVTLTGAVEGVAYVTFTAPRTGTYTVSCPEGTANVVVGPPMNMERVPMASGLFLGGLFLGIIGLVVTIIGALRLRSPRR